MTDVTTLDDGVALINQLRVYAWDENAPEDQYHLKATDLASGEATPNDVVTILVSDPNGDALTTGNGKAYYRVPSTLNGKVLASVAAAVSTASSSGLPTVQIHNVTDAVDMLSIALTIDASETDSSTAATPAVIDAANDDVATGDLLRIDVDVAGTGTKGLIVELQFGAA